MNSQHPLNDAAAEDAGLLTAQEVMKRYGVSKNTVYRGPLRTLAICVARRKCLRWPLSRLLSWEIAQSRLSVPPAGSPIGLLAETRSGVTP
jgi:hypothetical protein